MITNTRLPSKKILASSVYALVAVMSSAALVGCKTTASDTTDVTVSPTSLTLAPGGGAETVSIVGDGDVNLNGVSIDFGDYASDFDSSSVSSCGTANISGDTCTLSLKLASSAEETTTAIPVTVEGNQINSVDLSVNAAYATEQVSPDEVIFTGVDSSGQTVTVTNTSDSSFTVSSLKLVDTDTDTTYSGSEFSLLDSSGCTNVTLAKDESCSFKVATQTSPEYDPNGADVLLTVAGIEAGEIRLPVVTQLTSPLTFTADGTNVIDDGIDFSLAQTASEGEITITNDTGFSFTSTATAFDVDAFHSNLALDTGSGSSCSDGLAAGASCVVSVSPASTSYATFNDLLDENGGPIPAGQSSNLSLTTNGTTIDSQPVTIEQNNVVMAPDALDNLGLTSILLDNPSASSTSTVSYTIATPTGASGDLIELPEVMPTFGSIASCPVNNDSQQITVDPGGCRLVIRSTTNNEISTADQSSSSTLELTSGSVDNIYDIATNANLYAAGYFTANAGNDVPMQHIAKWNGSAWAAVDVGLGSSGTERPTVLALDNNDGFLIAGGDFAASGDENVTLDNIAYFDGLENGSGWQSINGDGFSSAIYALAVDTVTDPENPVLYIGGGFTDSNNASGVEYIAQTPLGDSIGASWSDVGDGLDDRVEALVFDSTNDRLYAAGYFSASGTTSLDRVAQFDPVAEVWSAFAGGIANSNPASTGYRVETLAVNEDTGVVAASGVFDGGTASPPTLDNYAQTTTSGTIWSSVSDDSPNNYALSLVIGGNILYAGGFFAQTESGDTTLNRIGQLDLSATTPSWSTVGDGFNSFNVFALLAQGDYLYAGGDFTGNAASTTTLDRVAAFDTASGATWQAVGDGFEDSVSAFAFVPTITTPTVE